MSARLSRGLLLLAPALALPAQAPASADPLCYGVEVVAVSTTTVTHCVPYGNLVACRTQTVAQAGVRVSVLICQPRR